MENEGGCHGLLRDMKVFVYLKQDISYGPREQRPCEEYEINRNNSTIKITKINL